MKISSVEEYGLRCMLQLAAQPDGRSLTLTQIAEGEGLSLPYVGKLMGLLRDAGLVDSVRGRGGGYVLSRPATEITLRETLSSLGGLFLEEDFCTRFGGNEDSCVRMGSCTIHSLWGVLQTLVDDVLGHTTLAELRSGEAVLNVLQRRAALAESLGAAGGTPGGTATGGSAGAN